MIEFRQYRNLSDYQEYMRNVVAHGYGSLDADTDWNTIKEDIPALKEFCLEKLKEQDTKAGESL